MGTPPALEKYEEGEYKDILKHKDEIDELIDSYTVTFDHTKMARVDYVILQLGMFELFFAKKKPPYKVVINEAIELSKEYGSSGSPKLVNGILGKAYESHEKR